MVELVYSDRFYIIGTAAEIRNRLADHARRYVTVKELVGNLTPKQ